MTIEAEEMIERLRLESKGVQSMLRMLEGNTEPEDIRMLQHAWLDPILQQLRGVESNTGGPTVESQ